MNTTPEDDQPECDVCGTVFDATPAGCACEAWLQKCACGEPATVIVQGSQKPQCAECAA